MWFDEHSTSTLTRPASSSSVLMLSLRSVVVHDPTSRSSGLLRRHEPAASSSGTSTLTFSCLEMYCCRVSGLQAVATLIVSRRVSLWVCHSICLSVHSVVLSVCLENASSAAVLVGIS